VSKSVSKIFAASVTSNIATAAAIFAAVLVPVSSAQAQLFGGGAAGGSMEQQIMGFAPIILMFVVLYFLMIRPQMKRAKDQKNMIDQLKKGDEVITAGGIVGKISKVGESYITVQVSRGDRGDDSGVEMNFQKSAVQTLLPNGTIKSI
jgi:preprotein translocase subunit YajC